jgi:hypothetical protein
MNKLKNMKYIIIGMHSSGKQEVADILENNGVRCGRLFTNMDNLSAPEVYNGSNYEQYTMKDVSLIFENNAYIFMQEFPECDYINVSAHKWYEGLSLYEFENNDVFVMSPDQFFSISPASIKEPVCFVWLDNTKKERLNRYYTEKRSYSFSSREEVETKDSNSFVKLLYGFNNSNVLYFTNEDPARIAAIMYSVIKHPELLDIYTQAFN